MTTPTPRSQRPHNRRSRNLRFRRQSRRITNCCGSRHERQARTWSRFATILRETRGEAARRAREALGWSLRHNTRGFALPVKIERRPGYSFGWDRLTRSMAEVRFPELEAKARYDEGRGADEVVLYVHYARRGGSQKAPVGLLPAFDAGWMTELLRDGLGCWIKVFVVEASAETAEVVIAGAWVAAHYWIDGYDDRRAARADGRYSEAETTLYRFRLRRETRGQEDATAEIDRLTGRLRSVLSEIDAREEKRQAADDLYAYAESLTGQLGYHAAQARSRNERPGGTLHGGDHTENEHGADDRFREVVFSDLSGSEYWPIHRVVQ